MGTTGTNAADSVVAGAKRIPIMIGITSYRDYFATNFDRKLKSLKGEALHQFCIDISEALGEEVEVVATKDAFQEDYLSRYSSLVLFDHPMSAISQKKHVGFTTANLHHHAITLKLLAEYEGQKYIISDQFVRIHEWLHSYSSRLKRTSFVKGAEVVWPQKEIVENTLYSAIDITPSFHDVRKRARAVFGDSHSTMLWSPGKTCYNFFGATLFRVLSRGLESYSPGQLEEATFCFGNIDLRYHLARQNDPELSTRELAKEYVKQASKIAPVVKIASLLPVTGEIKGIAKAYLYKKEQHYGSFELRKHLRNIFRDELIACSQNTCVTIIDPPDLYETEDGFLDEVFRENRGVHVCPSAYEYCLSNNSMEPRPQFAWKAL